MPSAAAIWIWICAYLNCAGWVLSGLHQLNAAGYAVVFAIGIVGLWYWRRQAGGRLWPELNPGRLRRRFRRGFPMAFLVLAGLAFLGGALHAPANYDALAYRTPRVLHWLAEGQWHWIHSDFPRLNTRTAGFEWLTAPQFLFLHTDRLVFLLNVVSFLLLPGRVYAVLTRLGVRPRAAWHWMWLLPSGYGYVLQAGSIANDLFSALMALTAIEFALRARDGRNVSDVWISGLAAALMTAVKAFNIVLLLPWLIAIFPALKGLLRRPLASAAVLVLALSASMVPTSVLDAKYCGDWTGAKIEHTPIGGGHELLRCAVNVPNLVLGNLVPPIFPFTRQWDEFVQSTLPDKVHRTLRANFEGGQASFRLPELQVEESSGLGCGVSLLLLALLAKKLRHGEILSTKLFSAETLIPLAAWAGIGVFLLRVGISGPARYLLPFYILLFTPLLAGPVAGGIFRWRGWRLAAYAVFAAAGLLLVLSPPRPLWPAVTVLRALDAEHSPHRLLNRAWNVYSVYGARSESFAPVLAKLPPGADPLGLISFDDPEASLWRPFGSRRVLHLRPDDSPEQIRARGIKYALVSELFFNRHFPVKLEDWQTQNRAVVIERFDLRLRAGQPPEPWRLVRFDWAFVQ